MLPSDFSGGPFVDLQVSDCFSIVVRNFSNSDSVAAISIDGLDVANEFSEDKAGYPGYYLGRKSEHEIPGWLGRLMAAIRYNEAIEFATKLFGVIP